MNYYDTHLDTYDLPASEPELYCTVFEIPYDMPAEVQDKIKTRELKELCGEVLAMYKPGRPYAITVDYVSRKVRDDGAPPHYLCKWTLRLESVRTQIVEVPRVEETHYNLPATDSLKERVAAAWNYIRGKGVLSP